MEPFSALTTVISFAEIALRTASALVEFTRNTKNASADRKMLAEETLALSKVLERLQSRTRSGTLSERWLEDRRDLLRQFARAHEDLATAFGFDVATGRLKIESRFNTIRTASKWSFTKSEVYSLLEKITRLQQYANTLLLDEQCSMIEQIDQRQQEAIDQKQKQTILNWLSPLQMAQVHQNIACLAGEGSGKWFITSQEYMNWQSGYAKLLWCPGIPGAGKTVMASIVVDHLRQLRVSNKINANCGIAVVYLKYNDPKQTLENILASLLKQLLQSLQSVPKPLEELFERHRDQNTTPSLDDISGTLLSLIEPYPDVFFIVDALDECTDEVRWELLGKLRECQPKVRLLITSRFLNSIDQELEDFERLEIKANRADLELFIDHRIEKNRNLRAVVQKSPKLRDDIKTAVIKTAEDMFLLASLHVESLASAAALSIRHVRRKLETLPTTLVGTYDEAMQRIEAQEPEHRAIALKTLSWVSYAFRSLSLGELQHALAIEPGQSELDEELLMDGHSITALCAGLVFVDLGTNTVNLVHYTAKKYFESIRLVRFPGFHASITMSCATYLALRELKDASVWQIARQYPLACYAAEYMGEHARHNPEETLEPSILQVICQLLSHPDKRKPLLSLLDGLDLIKSGFYYTTDAEPSAEGVDSGLVEATAEVRDISLEERSTFSTAPTAVADVEATLDSFQHEDCDFQTLPWETNTKPSHMPEVTALHLAASMGLAKVASLLINEVNDIDAVDETGKTALAVAMERGFEKAVEFLVNSGASVDLGSEHGQGVFLLINESDWHRVAEVVASKAKLTASKDDKSHTQYLIRLLLAAYSNDNTEVEHLIAKGNISLSGTDRNVGANALFLAIERSHAAMVHTLLVSGVAVDSTDSRGQTALHRATRRGSEPLISLLLEHGAEVDIKNDEGRTPWSANLRTRNWHSLGVLIKAGANPNTKGHQGVSELYEAATNGETDVVKFMIENGTNPSIKTQFLWAPLHWASYYGHLDCVKLLIDAGADLSPISDQDATPLDLALRANQIAVVDILTRAGAKESRDIVISTPSTPRNEVQPSDDWSSTLPSPQEGHLQTKLSLAFDKPLQQGMQVGQFAYPSTVKAPRDYIYQISHDLETLAPSLSVRQAQRRADMVEYPLVPEAFDMDDALFDIIRVASDYQTFEIGPRTQSTLAGSVSMHRDWTGGWKIHHNHDGIRDYLFRTTPDWSKMKEEGCRWSTEDGTLLARTGVEGVTPVFTFEHGSDRQMQDILVTCWVAKLWSETVALQRRTSQVPLSKE